MLFNSIPFLVFFPLVVLVYLLVPRKARYLWLLVASYYFYMSWSPRYALLIALSTALTYVSGRLLEHWPAQDGYRTLRRWIVAGSFVSNLGILAFFKYFTFFWENLNLVLGALQLQTVSQPFNLVLPVGISFYTFQALGYTMDVYRGRVAAERNLLKYALFVSFFPQLVAGPIERSDSLLGQINEVPLQKLLNYRRMTDGLIMMLYGFFLKMVVADRLALLVDTVFDNYYMYGSVELIAAAVGFSLQIYCDFSSYSTIAIGAAEVMGFHLMENFNAPYFSRSIQEFWRRWHISLSTWFRDYLYIPLGGNRCGRWRRYGNLLITFLVSGLWHGAQWHYVVWGGLHGAYQIVGDALRPVRQACTRKMQVKTDCASYKLLQMGFTFCLTTAAWVFFRADSVRSACSYLVRMVTRVNPWALLDGRLYTLGLNDFEAHVLLAALVVVLLVDWVRYAHGKRLDAFLQGQNLWFRWAVLGALCVAVVVFGEYGANFDPKQFIYFQF